MTWLMSEPITKEEREELKDRAEKLHQLYNLGGTYLVDDYVIDWVQGAGIWIYDITKDGEQIYSNHTRNPHADICDNPDQVREVLDALRRAMVLDDLADV